MKNADKYKNNGDIFSNKREPLQGYSLVTTLSDRLGNVMTKGEKIYRGINPYRVEVFKELWKSGILQSLIELNYLVDIKITNYRTEKFPLILEAEKLLIMRPEFFTFSMTRQIAINALVMDRALSCLGFRLTDAIEQNFTFKADNPLLIDIGSIVSRRSIGVSQQIDFFINTYLSVKPMLFKLLMLSTGKSFFARSRNVFVLDTGTTLEESLEYKAVLNYVFDFHRHGSSKTYNYVLQKVFVYNHITPEYIEFLFDVDFKEKPSQWGGYADEFFKQDSPSERFSRILQLMNEFVPKGSESFVDIGGNSGYFCSLVAKTNLFKSVINTDSDEVALERGREMIKGAGVSFYKVGFVDLPECTISADATAALAITHHLILNEGFNVFDCIKVIADITKKIAFIEFMPLGLYGGDGPIPTIPHFYTEDYFEQNFKENFTLLHKEVVSFVNISGKDYPHRVLFVGAKK